MAQPLVSCIIPCYNYKLYLGQCLESVLQQSYKNIEIIVVDDCSTDNPKEITDMYPSVKYIRHEKNKGLSGTRNTGIEASHGEYIFCLDSDDWIDKDLVDLSMQWFEAKKADIVGVWQQEFGDRAEVHHFHPNPVHTDFLNGNKINCSSMFKRQVYDVMKEKYGFGYDERLKKGYEDWQFWLRATKAGFTVATIPLALFHYRIHNASMIAGLIKKDLRNDTFEEMKDSIPEIFA